MGEGRRGQGVYTPFVRNQDGLVERLRVVVGRHALEILRFAGCVPYESCITLRLHVPLTTSGRQL